MRVFLMSKGRVALKKKKLPLAGGAVKAQKMFAETGKSALYSMLKPKTPQKYISFN